MKRGDPRRRWQLWQALRLAMRTSTFVPGPVRSAGSAGWWADLQVLERSRAHVFGRAAGARRSDRGQTRKADAEAVRSHLTGWIQMQGQQTAARGSADVTVCGRRSVSRVTFICEQRNRVLSILVGPVVTDNTSASLSLSLSEVFMTASVVGSAFCISLLVPAVTRNFRRAAGSTAARIDCGWRATRARASRRPQIARRARFAQAPVSAAASS